MALGERLQLARKANGLTQGEVEKSTGINRKTLSNWENDTSRPSTDDLLKLSICYHTSVDALLGSQFAGQDETAFLRFKGQTDSPFSRAVEKEHAKAGYYRDTAVAELAQELKENPDLRVLLDASRGLKKESLEEIKKFVEYQRMKESGL